MEGERELSRLLDAMEPKLYPERYSFRATSDPTLKEGDFAIVREVEGLSAIGPDPSGDWARISLGVHSSLEAVGLTAELSARLASKGIGANIIAGLFHDHLFVTWDRRAEALEALRG